jgi:D-arabinose 1-dehydrogenase-like Zn-dependent alcohol dehydrogenase
LIGLLKSHGKLVMVGAFEKHLEVQVFPLLIGRKMIGESMIGGIKETQEMIDFVAKHDVKPEIEVLSADYVKTVLERLLKAGKNVMVFWL